MGDRGPPALTGRCGNLGVLSGLGYHVLRHTRDWDWCYPLTLLDPVSRKCLGLQALDATDGYGVRPVFEYAFREAGLPLAILTDNGPPFVAPRGLRGLSELSVWWIGLSIRPLRTEPASPEQNQRARRPVDGLEETDDGVWSIHFCKEPVARYDERTQQVQR